MAVVVAPPRITVNSERVVKVIFCPNDGVAVKSSMPFTVSLPLNGLKKSFVLLALTPPTVETTDAGVTQSSGIELLVLKSSVREIVAACVALFALPLSCPINEFAVTLFGTLIFWASSIVNALTAVPLGLVVLRVSVRLFPVPAVIVIDDAPPVMLPTLVKLPVTSAEPSNDCPHRLRAVVIVEAVMVIFADPSNSVPLMVRPGDSVPAEPVVFWFSVGNVQFVNVPLVGVPSTGVTIVSDVHVPVGV